MFKNLTMHLKDSDRTSISPLDDLLSIKNENSAESELKLDAN